MSTDAIPLLRASQLRPVVAAMQRIGAPRERLLREAKLPLLVYEDPEAVVPELFAWDLAGKVARSQDVENFGQFAARLTPVWQSEPGLIHVLQTMPTLWLGLSAFCRLVERVSTAAPFGIERGGDYALLHRARRPKTPGDDQAELYCLEVLMQLVQLAGGRRWKPPEVLVSGVNASRLAVSEAFDGVRILQSDSCTGLLIPAGMLALPMSALATEPEMPLPDRLSDEFTESLRAVMTTYLRECRPDVHLAAEMAGVSERTLQRRLHDAQVSYRMLLDQVRLEQALTMLRETNTHVTDIAYDLGFSDAAHFTRAFRRWTALSPREYRRQHPSEGLPAMAENGKNRDAIASILRRDNRDLRRHYTDRIASANSIRQ